MTCPIRPPCCRPGVATGAPGSRASRQTEEVRAPGVGRGWSRGALGPAHPRVGPHLEARWTNEAPAGQGAGSWGPGGPVTA